MARNKKTTRHGNIPAEDSFAAEGPSSDEEESETEVPMQGDSTADEGNDPSTANDGKDSTTDGEGTGNGDATSKVGNDEAGDNANGPPVEDP